MMGSELQSRSKRNCERREGGGCEFKDPGSTPTLPSGKSTMVSPRPGTSECKFSRIPYSVVNSSKLRGYGVNRSLQTSSLGTRTRCYISE
ncbi:hypothetical protein Tco_1216656 [Tanacetum coccineum]